MKSSVKISFHSGLLWNAVYIARIALYLIGLTGFSFWLSPLAYLLQCVHLPWRVANRCYRVLAAVFTLALFYHDSFLPGWEQLMAQRANLTGFSISYMVDFLVSFINPYMVVGFLIIIGAVKLLGHVVRATTCILLGMAVLPLVNTDSLRALYDENDVIAVNQGFLNQISRNDEAVLDQRGNFTKSNLERYLNRFYEREAKRKVSFPETLDPNFNAFNVVLLSVDGFASADLEQSQALEHAALKRFDIVFSNFNTVTTDPQLANIRLLTSACGQGRGRTMLSAERFKQCSLYEKFTALGYATSVASDDPAVGESLVGLVKDEADVKLTLVEPEGQFFTDGIFPIRNLFDSYIHDANISPAPLIRLITVDVLHSSRDHADYDSRLKAFLLDVNRFIDELERNGRPTLLILLPLRGSGMVADRMQLAGRFEIPSYMLTHGRLFAKFVGLKGHYRAALSDEPLSYMAVAELLSRSISGNIYDPELMPSFLSLTDGLSRTAYIGENTRSSFMIFKGRMFYKDDQDQQNWSEYLQ